MIKRPVFRTLRDRFAFVFNIKKNLDKLKLIQLKFKKRYRERTIMKKQMEKLLNNLIRKRQLESFKSIRLKNPNPESFQKITSIYRERVNM